MFQTETNLNLLKIFLLFSIIFLSIPTVVISSEKQEILDTKPFCEGNFYISPKKIRSLETLPLRMDIQFSKSKIWYQNVFSLVQYLGNPKYKHTKKIPKKFKRFSPVNILVEYTNNKVCKFKGMARIHGGRGDHVSNKEFITSLRVKLSNGGINNIDSFILFLPESRNNNNEIFTTLLLEKMEVLSPFSMNVDVKINESNFSQFIFQEKIDSNFLNRNAKANGMILASNKSYQISDVYENFDDSYDRLSFVAEDQFSTDNDILNAINNLNYFLIQNYILNKNDFYNQKILEGETILTSIESLDQNFTRIKKTNFLIFNTLMLSMGASHALGLHDIKYYFDNFYNTIEPIYYDGQSRILQKYDLSEDTEFTGKVLKSHKAGALLLLERLNNIDIVNFNKELSLRKMNLGINELENIFELIKKNLNTIIGSEILSTKEIDINNLNFDFFKKNSEKEIFITFGGKNNIINICNINLDNCKEQLITKKTLNSILRKQISVVDDKNLFYVGQSFNKFKNRLVPDKHGIEILNKIKIYKDSNIYYKYKTTNIDIDRIKKIIEINVFDAKERVVFIVDNFENWKIDYNNINVLSKNYKKSNIKEKFPSGCINFLDSNIKNIEIKIAKSDCPDAAHFFKTTGHISRVEINNSAYDGLDVDFSKLLFNKIVVNETKQECVGFKSGNYIVKNAVLKNCGDKAFSNGEISTVSIENIDIQNSKNGIISKDSSEIFINNYSFENISDLCLGAYKGKVNYTGSLIKIKKILNNCDEEFRVVQNGSDIKIIKNEF